MKDKLQANISGKVGQIVAKVDFHPSTFETMTNPAAAEYQKRIAEIKAISARANTPGYNEHGVPLHACNGYKQDAHYWQWVRSKQVGGVA
jgi:hypothetical protein